MTPPPTPVRPPDRRLQQRGRDTRHELLQAALHEFASMGFDAASTRAIATRAGVRQGQLTYHYATKDALWRATVDHLFARFEAEFAAGLDPVATDASATTALTANLRALVRAVSRLPELNRVMVHEATEDSPRLAWLVDTHVRRHFEQFSALWAQVQGEGGTHLQADPVVMFYCVVGAASLLYVNAPEARRLRRRTTPTSRAARTARTVPGEVEAHADLLVAMLLGRPSAAHATATT